MNNNFFNPDDEIKTFFKEQEIQQQEKIKIEYSFNNSVNIVKNEYSFNNSVNIVKNEYTFNNYSRITKVENILLYLDKNEITKIKKQLCCSSKIINKTKHIYLSGHQYELKNILNNKYNLETE